MHPLDLEPCQQRCHVCLVLRICVIPWIRQPVAAAAPDDIDRDDAIAPRQPLGEEIEIMGVARQAVNAEHRRPAVVRAPFEIADAMEAAWAEAEEVVFGERTHPRTRMSPPPTRGRAREGEAAFRCERVIARFPHPNPPPNWGKGNPA